MRSTILLAAVFAAASATAALAAADSDAFQFLTPSQVTAAVAAAPKDGSPAVKFFSKHDDFVGEIVERSKSGTVEIHDNYTDYMIFVDGKATLTIGGTVKNKIANPNHAAGEWLGDSSTGGKVYNLEPGAMIVIPKGVPHWMQLPAGGHFRYITFKRKG